MSHVLRLSRKALLSLWSLFALLLCSSSPAPAQSAQVVYLDTLSGAAGPQGQAAHALAFDRQGNIWVAGTDAAFVAKLDPTGQTILYRTFLGGAAADRANALTVAPDGDVYVAGAVYSAGAKPSGFVTKLGAAGEQIWYRPVSAPIIAVAVNSDGAVYYASAASLTKLDSFEVAAPGAATSLAVSPGGAVWVAGENYAARLNAVDERWDAILHLENTTVRVLALDAAGVPFLAAVEGSRAFVARVQADASRLAWRTELANSHSPTALAVAPDESVLVAGNSTLHGFLTQMDSSGRILDTAEIGESTRDRVHALSINPHAEVWVAGSRENSVREALLATLPSKAAQAAKDASATSTHAGTAAIALATTVATPRTAETTLTLGTNSLTFGHGSGSGTLVIGGTWTASTTTPWLHIANSSGLSTDLFRFSYDANPSATRTGFVHFNGSLATLTVTQAGERYAPTNELKDLLSSVGSPAYLGIDTAGDVYFTTSSPRGGYPIKRWSPATGEVATVVPSNQLAGRSIAVDGAGNVYFIGTTSVQKWTAATEQITPLGFGLGDLGSLAVDAIGNLYFMAGTVCFPCRTEIGKWTVATGQVTTLFSLPESGPAPFGLAVDAAGNVYVSDTYNNAVEKWTAAVGQVTTLISAGLNVPTGVAVDAAGNVYIAEIFNNAIKKWSPATGQVSKIAFADSFGVAVDRAGDVYFGANYAIKKWTAETGQVSTLKSAALIGPDSIALDAAGNAYISDSGNCSGCASLKKWTAATGQLTTLLSRQPSVGGIAADAVGNVYFAQQPGNCACGSIKKRSAATGQITTLISGLAYPGDVALDRAGNVYFTTNAYPSPGTIQKWTAATGNLTTLLSGLPSPGGLTVDAAGNVYFGTFGSTVFKWNPNGETTQLLSGLILVEGLAVDGAGRVYIAGAGVKRWSPHGQITSLISPSTPTQTGGVALDASGNSVYIVDVSNNAIKRFVPAFMSPSPVVEPLTAGSDRLLPVLPTDAPLDAVSDQSWLSITSQDNAVVHFSFTAAIMPRTAHITVLGQTIPVTQTNDKIPTAVFYRALWGSESYTWTGSARHTLPWEISGIQVVFSEPIVSGDTASLSGLNATALSGLGTNTLTWAIDPVSFGSFTLALAERGPHALRDGAGNTLTGNTRHSLNVLWGDFNDDGVVSATDLTGVNLVRLGVYNLFADLNGDDAVDASDVQIVRNQMGKTLP